MEKFVKKARTFQNRELRRFFEFFLKTLIVLVVATLLPPVFLCFTPTFLMWVNYYSDFHLGPLVKSSFSANPHSFERLSESPAYNIQSSQVRVRNYFVAILLTAFIPGLVAFWGFEVLYVSLVQKIVAITNVQIPYFIGDGDSFEYFSDSGQAFLIILLYLITLVPTYTIFISFYVKKARTNQLS
jgi:hypothetical protein